MYELTDVQLEARGGNEEKTGHCIEIMFELTDFQLEDRGENEEKTGHCIDIMFELTDVQLARRKNENEEKIGHDIEITFLTDRCPAKSRCITEEETEHDKFVYKKKTVIFIYFN
ncbi:hypothetical protein PoB_004882500 [Plakobranchus ocellatus]|uniref:Uncharacterized protein n=1 Tax=Plakobranchus ocellatus TaxID=259542 RepID=A0AAV4BT68_9GAST|nr:hypothetical protein PoB_004882500 [Plakobranchus ocellatus]